MINPAVIKQKQKNAEMSNQSVEKLGPELDKSNNDKYILKLFVIGTTPDTSHAINNISKFCEKYLKGRYTLDIIDLIKEPHWASEENIFAVPLLIKKNPLPEERLIGDLSDTQKILSVFNITEH